MLRNEFMAGPAGITIMYDEATALFRMSKDGRWQMLWVRANVPPGEQALTVVDDVSNTALGSLPRATY